MPIEFDDLGFSSYPVYPRYPSYRICQDCCPWYYTSDYEPPTPPSLKAGDLVVGPASSNSGDTQLGIIPSFPVAEALKQRYGAIKPNEVRFISLSDGASFTADRGRVRRATPEDVFDFADDYENEVLGL